MNTSLRQGRRCNSYRHTQKDRCLIDEDNQSLMIDRNKLRGPKEKFRKPTREEETNLFKLVDGRKNATQIICLINEKFHRNIIFEEHYITFEEPGEFYLTHCTPEDIKRTTIAECLYDTIKDNTLQKSIL